MSNSDKARCLLGSFFGSVGLMACIWMETAGFTFPEVIPIGSYGVLFGSLFLIGRIGKDE